jgi:hypothetical protein
MAFSASPYLDAVRTGTDAQRYFAIVALRLNALTPEALVKHLPIAYFVEGTDTPPNARNYNSGLCVDDILEGRSDWSTDEVEELRHLVTDDARFKSWLQARFDEIDDAIQTISLFAPGALGSPSESDEIDADTIMRAAIHRAAMEPDAMSHLRAHKRSA